MKQISMKKDRQFFCTPNYCILNNNNKRMINKRLAIGTYIIRFVVKILQLSIIYDLQVSLSSDIFILCSMIIHRIGMVTLNFGTVQWNAIDIEMHVF